MLKKQRNNIFNFENNEVDDFLKNNHEICFEKEIFKESKKFSLHAMSPDNKTLKNSLNYEKFENKTPENAKKYILPANEKLRKTQQYNFDSSQTLSNFGKSMNKKLLNSLDSTNFLLNKNIFNRNFTQTKKENQIFSSMIEDSIKEMELENSYLLYLGCQKTPDLNLNNIFSNHLSKKGNFNTLDNNSEDQEKIKYEKNFFEKEIQPKELNIDNLKNTDAVMDNFSLILDQNKKTNKLKNFNPLIKNDIENKTFIYKKDNNINNINYDYNEKFDKGIIHDNFFHPKNVKESSIEESIDYDNMIKKMSEFLESFNTNKDFIKETLNSNNTKIWARDLNLKFLEVQIDEFLKHFYKIKSNFDSSYFFSADEFVNNLIIFNIPSTISFLIPNDSSHNDLFLEEIKANLKLSIKILKKNQLEPIKLEEINIQIE